MRWNLGVILLKPLINDKVLGKTIWRSSRWNLLSDGQEEPKRGFSRRAVGSTTLEFTSFISESVCFSVVCHPCPPSPHPPPGPDYLAPYLFFSYMHCSCLESGLWTGWSKSFVTWYSLLGLSVSWLFFWLSLSRPTRAASCNTIQMEYSKKERRSQKERGPQSRPPPSSVLPSLFLLQQAAFCFGCFADWASEQTGARPWTQKPSWLFFLVFLSKRFCMWCYTIVNQDWRPNKHLI